MSADTRSDFILPDLGEGLAEAEIIAWLVPVGSLVHAHDPLVEVQTDKAIVELPSPVDGRLVRCVAEAGAVVSVGSVIAQFELPDDGQVPPAPVPAPAPAPAGEPLPDGSAPRPRVLAPPAVRRRAVEVGVDLATVAGTGPGGRITHMDLDRHAIADGPTSDPPVPGVTDVSDANDERRVPLRGLRRAIARSTKTAWSAIPHVTGMVEVDVTELAAVRRTLVQDPATGGVPVTWTVMFALATVQAVHSFPVLNASLDEDRDEIVLKRRVHLGVATSSPDGLIVPVVRDADRLSLLSLASEVRAATDRARDRTSTPAELSGGTLTLSNYGTLGGWFGTPLILHPQVAIAGFGAVTERPMVVDGAIVARSVCAVSVSVDHRVADGDVLSGFTSELRRRLENPALLLLGAPPW